MRKIIMMAGLPGTGKSTAAGRLQQALGWELHSILGIMQELGHQRFRPKSVWKGYIELFRRTESSLASGRDVILDHSFHQHFVSDFPIPPGVSNNLGRQRIYDMVEREPDTWAAVIECVCSPAVARRRIRSRPSGRGTVADARDPRVHTRYVACWEPIENDFDRPRPSRISYLTLQTEEDRLTIHRAAPRASPFVERLRRVLT